MSPPVRRNDPCPCGSGLRYKECHGRLGAESAEPPVQALVERALRLHQQGEVAEAERRYRAILARDPGNAVATHYLGMASWHRGELAEAERLMRESIAANASIPDFHNNLALLLRDTRRPGEALEGFRRALAVDPGWFEAYNNLGLTLEALDRWDEACEAYRSAIAREPRFAVARQNLARALLARGALREGWEQYRWRLLAQGVAAQAPDPGERPLPESLSGRAFALRAEQGIGDVLFFLRFAPELARRGARLAFRGDTRLHSILERTGLFPLGLDAERAPAPAMETLFIGDLPWRLGVDEPGRFPPLALTALADRVRRLEERYPRGSHGGTRVGLTWRAGLFAPGPTRLQLKQIELPRFAGLVRRPGAIWISVQRHPQEGEREALEQALGAPVLDAAAANDDLEEILALMAVLDDYAGVSNANVHLRAGLGLPMEVLVPFPPEWRWGLAGPSPWFATARVRRQLPSGEWREP